MALAAAQTPLPAGRGWWQAVISEPDGEQVITRHTLGRLLDKLDELQAKDSNQVCSGPA